MKVIADLCIVPMGVGTSVSGYVKTMKEIFDRSPLITEMHANGTNIEGELGDITKLIEECEEKLVEMRVERVFCTLIFSSRHDKPQTMQDKLSAIY